MYTGLGADTQETIKKLKHVAMKTCTLCVRTLETPRETSKEHFGAEGKIKGMCRLEEGFWKDSTLNGTEGETVWNDNRESKTVALREPSRVQLEQEQLSPALPLLQLPSGTCVLPGPVC